MRATEAPAAERAPAGAGPPLCVDLDGTLIRTDSLHELLVRACLRRPLALPGLVLALGRGRAAFKRAVSDAVALDPRRLPYQEDLLAFLREEKARGRTLVLATAADEQVARPIADHLALFDEVLCSDGASNLKAGAKADRLAARFGERGFAYAGNSSADLPVWARSAEPILVNTPAAVAARVEGAAPRRFGGPGPDRARALLKAMRVYQWVKNVLVFLPLLLAHRLVDRQAVIASVIAFAAFCLIASSIYLVNDLADLDADREHPRKRRRPFASGDLPLSAGVLAPVLLGAGLGLAWALRSPLTLAVLAVYVVATSAYSSDLKTRPLIDVFTLAALYTIRLVVGSVATGIPLSIWLVGFALFSFLSLAFLKRTSELTAVKVERRDVDARRGYRVEDHFVLQAMGVAAAFLSVVILALYLSSPASHLQYRAPFWLWFVVPVVLYAQCRLWLVAARGEMSDDPIVYAAKDRACWAVIALIGAAFAAASLTSPAAWMGG